LSGDQVGHAKKSHVIPRRCLCDARKHAGQSWGITYLTPMEVQTFRSNMACRNSGCFRRQSGPIGATHSEERISSIVASEGCEIAYSWLPETSRVKSSHSLPFLVSLPQTQQCSGENSEKLGPVLARSYALPFERTVFTLPSAFSVLGASPLLSLASVCTPAPRPLSPRVREGFSS
jgi:hypothetical protein